MDEVLSGKEFDTYFSESYRPALQRLTMLVNDPVIAEDMLHEALARAWDRRAKIVRLDAYVMVTAVNLARGRWRKRTRETLASNCTAAAIPSPDQQSVDVQRAIASLPTRQRQAAVLFYICDIKIPDVAAYLGISCGGAKHALHSARASLAKRLGPNYMKETKE